MGAGHRRVADPREGWRRRGDAVLLDRELARHRDGRGAALAAEGLRVRRLGNRTGPHGRQRSDGVCNVEVAESGRPGRAELLAKRPHNRLRRLSAELQNVGEAPGKLRPSRTF